MAALFGAVLTFIGLLDCLVLVLVKLTNDTNKLVEEKIEQMKKPLNNFWRR